jgi:glycosyltransferase involved in cell wall biosynthesis
VHNEYGRFSGEEAVLNGLAELLQRNGHYVTRFTRSSADIPGMLPGQVRAFLGGIYNPASRMAFRRFLAEEKPNLINLHNLYPLISPAVLPECRRAGIPVVMTVHNYRLICPNGLFLSHGEICERCAGGREYWCIVRNCEGRLPKSVGYALRNAVARGLGLYSKYVQVFACLTDFQRRKLIEAGFPEERMVVIPNALDVSREAPQHTMDGDYVGFVGRVSREKGLDLLLDAARLRPDIPFRIAGHADDRDPLLANLPPNVFLRGQLGGRELLEFYRQARIIVMQGKGYEGFPMVLLEAMQHGKPAVGPRLGGIPEIIEDGRTGLLFESGNMQDYVASIARLWDSPGLCVAMGEAAKERLGKEYSSDRYYKRFMAATELAKQFLDRDIKSCRRPLPALQ